MNGSEQGRGREENWSKVAMWELGLTQSERDWRMPSVGELGDGGELKLGGDLNEEKAWRSCPLLREG